MFATASWVFDAAKVDGFNAEEQEVPADPAFDPIARAVAFASATKASIAEGGDKACYIPSQDMIRMPERRRFVGSATTTLADAFYSTRSHELVHWSGAKLRLDRGLSRRFGSDIYAVE